MSSGSITTKFPAINAIQVRVLSFSVQTAPADRFLPVVRKSKDAVRARARSDSASRATKPLDESRTRLNLVEHYLGLVLVILVEAGLFDVSILIQPARKRF